MTAPFLRAPGPAPGVRSAIPASNSHTLTEAASVLLDVVRFAAAIAVVIGHLTLPELNAGFTDRRHLGEHAVPIFFVLSGFVIRFVTRSREHNLRVFFIDRASRMYSIMLPAIALTLLVSGFCFLVDRQHYVAIWGPVSNHILARVLINLTFLSQSWGHNTVPLINTPFWSLSYECLYYIAYGLLFFLRGWRRTVSLIVWAGIAGPQVLFLFPIWWLGCWIYDLYHHLRQSRYATLLGVATVVYALLALALFSTGRTAPLLAPIALLNRFSALRNPLELLHLSTLRSNLMAFGTGVLSGIGMLLLLFVSDLVTIPRRNLWARRFRRIADGTFAIYLMHFPLLVLALFLGLLRPTTHALSVLVATVICLLLIGISGPLDRLKRYMRDQLRRRFHLDVSKPKTLLT